MRGIFAVLCLGLVTVSVAEANSRLPACKDNRGADMRIDNDRVIELKRTTQNQYKDRAFVQGVLVGVLQDRKSHLHLDIFLGEGPSGTGKESDIEIIYNKAFDNVDSRALRPGMEVAACGDFINSFKHSGRYPPSPVGAIIHWTHMAPRPPHPHGFLWIDGRLYGQTDPQDRFNNFFDDAFEFFKEAM